MASNAEPDSFTIQFPEHVPATKQKAWLDRLGEFGASVEQSAPSIFRVYCTDAKALSKVGRLLLSSAMSRSCRVISTTGGAEARASAYTVPSRKRTAVISMGF